MKIIHLADLHLGKYFNGVSLLEDQSYILDKVLKIIEKENPDVVIMAGDIYDRSVPREDAVKVYNKFITKASKLSKNNLIIAGNHDSAERLSVLNSLLKGHGLIIEGNVKDPLRMITIDHKDGPVDFYFFPYKDTSVLKAIFDLKDVKGDSNVYEKIIERSLIDNDHRKVMIYHGFVLPSSDEAKEDIATSDSERFLSVGGHEYIKASVFNDFDYVALGHLHKPQWVVENKIRYSGSILKYSFSEKNHKKSISIIELGNDGSVLLREEPLVPLRDVIEIEGSFTDLMNEVHLESTDDFVKVSLLGDEEILDPMNRLRNVYPNVIELERKREIRGVTTDSVDSLSIKNKDVRKLFTDFYKEKNGKEMEKETSKMFDEILKELGGQNEAY